MNKKLAKKNQKASKTISSSTKSSAENHDQIQTQGNNDQLVAHTNKEVITDKDDSAYIPRHRFDQFQPGDIQNDLKAKDINQVSLSHKNKIFTSDLNELFSIPSKSTKKLCKVSDNYKNDVEMIQADNDENNNDPHLNHQFEEKDEEDNDVICLDDLHTNTNDFSNTKTTIDNSPSVRKKDGATSSDTVKMQCENVHEELNTLTVVYSEVANNGESESQQLSANNNNSKKSKRRVTAKSSSSAQESSTREKQIIKSPEVKNNYVKTSALGADHSQADLSSVRKITPDLSSLRKITPAFANPNQFQLRFILPGVHTPVVPSMTIMPNTFQEEPRPLVPSMFTPSPGIGHPDVSSKTIMQNCFQEEPRPLVPSMFSPSPGIGHPDDAIDLSAQAPDQCETTFPGSIIKLNTQPPVVQTGQSNQSSHFLPGSFINYNMNPFAFPQNVLPTNGNSINSFQNIQPPMGSSQVVHNVENSNTSQFQPSTNNIASSKPELMRLLCLPPANQMNSSSIVGCPQQLGQPIQTGGIPTNLTTIGNMPSVFLATGTTVSSAPVSTTTGTGSSSVVQGNSIQQPNQLGGTNVLPLDTTLQNQLSYCFLPVVNADGSQGIVPFAILPKPPTNPISSTSMPVLMNTSQSAPMNTLPTPVTSLSHTSQSAPTNRLPTPVKSLVSDTLNPSASALDESPVDDVIKSFYGNSVVKTSSFETKTTPTRSTVARGSPTAQHTTTSTMKTPEILNVSTISETNWKAAHTSTEKQKIQTRSRSGRNGFASKRLREKLTKKINEKEEHSSRNLRKLKDYVEENNKMKIRKLLMKEKSQKVRDVLLKALKKFDDNCSRKQKKAKLLAEDTGNITDPEYHELCQEKHATTSVNHGDHNELISAEYLSGK